MARRSGRKAPPGRTVLQGLRKKLADGWPAGLTVLSGDDLYHLDAAQRDLLAALVPAEATEFALTVFDQGKTDVGTIVAAARSVGMFATTRVILVRDVTVLEGEPAVLVDFARRPPPKAYLFVRAPVLDRRRKLHQALAEAGTLLEFGAPTDGNAMASEVASVARSKGLNLDRDAAGFLAEVCAGDLYRADTELEKVRLWVGTDAAAEVDLATVRETASGSGLLSGWEVANAVLERDRKAAARAVRQALEAGDEPLRVVGGLAFRARAMLRAKVMIDQGRPPRSAAIAARLFGISDTAIARGLARYTVQELLAFPAALMRADRDLKSRSIAPAAVLEATVDRLVRGAAAAPGVRL